MARDIIHGLRCPYCGSKSSCSYNTTDRKINEDGDIIEFEYPTFCLSCGKSFEYVEVFKQTDSYAKLH